MAKQQPGPLDGLLARIRPGVEAAPWVVAELIKLDAELSQLQAAGGQGVEPVAWWYETPGRPTIELHRLDFYHYLHDDWLKGRPLVFGDTHPPAAPVLVPLDIRRAKALVMCLEAGYVSVSMVQRRLEIGWNDAKAICQHLVEAGYVNGLEVGPSLQGINGMTVGGAE